MPERSRGAVQSGLVVLVGLLAVVLAALLAWIYFDLLPGAAPAMVAQKPMPRAAPVDPSKAIRDLHQPKNLVFSAKTCTEAAAKPEAPARDVLARVTDSGWQPDGTLTIEARVSMRCGVIFAAGSYRLEEDRLRLDYHVRNPPGPWLGCQCEHALQYAISGIENRPYRIEISGPE